MRHGKGAAAAAVAGMLVLSACGGSGGDDSGSTAASGKPRIELVINGGLGDKSFFDSAYEGLKKAQKDLGYDLKVVELGSDRTKWEPGFEDAAAAGDYDILAAGTFDVTDYVGDLAPQYPDKKFWVFDSAVDYSGKNGTCSNKCENVYSVTFKQNEGGYLAGFLAEKLVAGKALKGAESLDKVGVMGGVKIPVIEDFVVGFKAGFKAAGGKDSDVLVQYVGGDKPFGDPAKGKEISTALYGQGAALVWPVAGLSGLGTFESAVTAQRYTFGVDSDQYQTLTDQAQKNTVVTSLLKNVGNALYKAAQDDRKDSLKYGAVATVGLAEDAVGYVNDAHFAQLVPEKVRTELQAAADRVKSGSVTVPSAF
ncbi:BMP family lipoprotein [Streptomyces aurantiogriseus]|uniref:BMP family ABC transporter substrate-binding protein n=1 Tax=Streptomyces aurantiogriseus TaxID=66870 RepID=A0A918L0M5_9ACTN|nr:BMP family ABC transporter substrate-binding protein [Streptomyces aurantiogriseus]GGR62852.1 BMP family ABC transporter substrate-binding protein [Streptomyces aurantiogriseus]